MSRAEKSGKIYRLRCYLLCPSQKRDLVASKMSAHKGRPPLAKIQSTLEHSKAKGAELAKQAATARLEEEEAELAKREQARELMERRKAYGRATKRMGSPSPRRPLAGVQPSGFPSPRGAGSSSASALSSMRSQLSADETRPASLASSPQPSRRTLAARAASPHRLLGAPRRRLGTIAGQASAAPTALGVSVPCGWPRGRAPRSQRLAPWRAAWRRRRRLRKVAKRLPARRRRLFKIGTTGVRPALFYGARAPGATGDELQQAWRLLLATALPCTALPSRALASLSHS